MVVSLGGHVHPKHMYLIDPIPVLFCFAFFYIKVTHKLNRLKQQALLSWSWLGSLMSVWAAAELAKRLCFWGWAYPSAGTVQPCSTCHVA